MPSLIVLVFVLQLAIHLVNTFGANTINSVVGNGLLLFLFLWSATDAELAMGSIQSLHLAE